MIAGGICIEVAFVSVLPFKRTCLVWLGKVIVASLLAGIVTFNNKLLSFSPNEQESCHKVFLSRP